MLGVCVGVNYFYSVWCVIYTAPIYNKILSHDTCRVDLDNTRGSIFTRLYFLHPCPVSHNVTPFFSLSRCKHIQKHKHTQTHTVCPYNSAISSPRGSTLPVFRLERQKDIEALTEKERDSVLYFVVPGFDLSIPTLCVFNLKSGRVPPILSSFYISCIPLLL